MTVRWTSVESGDRSEGSQVWKGSYQGFLQTKATRQGKSRSSSSFVAQHNKAWESRRQKRKRKKLDVTWTGGSQFSEAVTGSAPDRRFDAVLRNRTRNKCKGV